MKLRPQITGFWTASGLGGALEASIQSSAAHPQVKAFFDAARQVVQAARLDDKSAEIGARCAVAGRPVGGPMGHAVGVAERLAQGDLSAGRVASSSVQIAKRNLDVSSRTEQQASALQQTAAEVRSPSRSAVPTQQNAALAEQRQSAAAAENLRQQAQELVRSVAVFRLGGSMA